MTENREAMNNKIMAICPDVMRKVYVKDDWYPSFTERGTNKLYVECEVFCRYDSIGFYTKIVFWGKDDFALEKEYANDDMNEVIKAYREFRKYAKNVPQNKYLQDILYRDGFKMF